MEFLLTRNLFGERTTISDVTVNGRHLCYVLEDAVRQRDGEPVSAWKVKGETAIPTGRYEQDRLNRDWRDTIGRPTGFIHDDSSITMNRIVDSPAELKLECYRVPKREMEDAGDEPEISAVHHRRLDGWVRYRAYLVPDADFGDKTRAAESLADFEDYFGRRPDADHRRENNANRPHLVKCW